MEKKKKYIKFTIIFFIVVLLSSIPFTIYASILSISPNSGTYRVGDKITVRVVVSASEPINAISGTVLFPLSLFTVESVSKSISILNFWVTEPKFSKETGLLSFEGIALEGFNVGTGTIVTVVLRAIKVGSDTITFKSGQILANDGQGTDVINGKTGAMFYVEAKKQEPAVLKTEEVETPTIDIFQKTPTLKSPEIVLNKKFGEQVIMGISDYSRAQVLLTFIAENGVKIFITTNTDNNGGFSILVPQTLKHGIYKTSAVVIQENLTNSYTSNEIIVKVGNFISDISMEIRTILSILALILLYLIIRGFIYLKRNKKLRLYVQKEALEAEDVLQESFKTLNTDIITEIGNEADPNKTNNLKKIKNDLDKAEELINKEIKNIEKL